MKKGVVAIVSATMGLAAGIAGAGKIIKKPYRDKDKLADKHLKLFLLMNQWVKVKQQNKNIADFLIQKGYKKVAIYGMSYAGETLYDELKGSVIDTVYGVDKNATGIYAEMIILSPEDTLPEVDAIIVTPIFFLNEIREKLGDKTKADVISIEDILYEI